jgi:Tol biopolymer transport system component
MDKRLFIWIGLLLALLACNLGMSASTPTTDLFATLSASTPLSANPAATTDPAQAATSVFLSTPISSTMTVPTSSSTDQPTGQIVYTCQIFKVQASNQICIINADGTGFRRLTTDDTKQHNYPSLSPDGKSVVYVAFRQANIYEIYEMNLATGNVVQLTNKLGNLNAPEISPDGKHIIFKTWSPNTDKNILWMMDRNGENADKISRVVGWDPTWSPDGKYVLFASDMDGAIQLFRIGVNGKELHRVSNLPAIRGRSDLSSDGQFIVTYSGEPWKHEVYIMTADGLNARMLSPAGGNSQGPSFSPDGKWVTFTSYYDHPDEDQGCEIYILRVDGTDLRRLTDNDYCDYQPRWGP